MARAQIAAKLGTPAIAAVAGQRIDRDAREHADQSGVRQLIAAREAA